MQIVRSLLSAVALFGAAAADYVTEESVIVLGDDTLADAIQDIPFLLVEFYAPWCGHCKQLAPEYASAAQDLEDNEDVKLAKVDATVHSAVASEYGVSGYPTLKFFKNGAVSDYSGGRTAKDIVSWIQKKIGPAVHNAADVASVETLKESNPVVVVLFATDTSEENSALTHFTKLADSREDVTFVLVSDANVAEELEIEGENSVVLFKQYDEGRINFSGEKVTKSKLEAFIKPHLLPYVVEFSDEVVERLFGGEIKEHMIYFRKDAGSDEDNKVVEQYRNVAKAHQGELLFVAVNMNVDSNSRLAEFFGLADSDYPAVRVIKIEGQPTKFKAPEGFELTEAGFELFASTYIAGEIAPALNTEEVPEDWDSEEVKVVVGKNFEEVCFDESKNVILMAHAPWCGHCKSLMPIFEELADGYEDDENVIVAKMDATKNEVSHFSIQGFPTLKFFPSGSNEIISYEGGRDLESLMDFIEENRGDAEVVEEGEGEAKDEEVDEVEGDAAEEAEEKDEL